MHQGKKLIEFETPLLGKRNHRAVEGDTGSDCPYTQLNDETVDNFESQAGDEDENQMSYQKGFNIGTSVDQQSPDNSQKEFLVRQRTRPYIGKKNDAPDYHRYNPYILAGYRINYNSWGSTLWSLFQCHNETMNVWSHFLGFLATFAALIFLCCNYTEVTVKTTVE